MSIKKLTALSALLALAACDVEKEELETLTLELNASAEDIDYGTTVTSVSYTHLTLPTT